MDQRRTHLGAAALALGGALLACSPSMAPAAEPAATGVVAVGVATIDITPDVPVRMYGYASRTTESEGVVQRLWAKALALGGDEGEGPAVLLMVENGAVPSSLVEDLASCLETTSGVQRERFMLCNTHIHSGPRPGPFPVPDDLESLSPEEQHTARYMTQLRERLERVVRDALGARQPARLAWSCGKAGFAGNRRTLEDGRWVRFGQYADGPVDHTLSVLRVSDLQGKPVAVVLNYACHCTVMRPDFKKIHGDWAGCAQEFIEADHPGVTALVCIGCGADADPYPHGTVELAEQHGREIAREVARLLEGPWTPIDPSLTARVTRIALPLETPTREVLEKRIEAAKVKGASADARYLGSAAQDIIAKLDAGEQLPESREYMLAAWIFGDDLAMIFLAGEVVVDYALRLKRELDATRLWINAYSNEVAGYIPSRRILAEGGYEANRRPTRYLPAVEDQLVEAVRSLVPESFRAPPAAAE